MDYPIIDIPFPENYPITIGTRFSHSSSYNGPEVWEITVIDSIKNITTQGGLSLQEVTGRAKRVG